MRALGGTTVAGTVAGAVLGLVLASPVGAAVSPWTDPVTVAPAAYASATVAAPAAVRCTGALLSLTYAWDEVDPRYDYRLVVRRLDTGTVVSSATATGSATSVSFVGLASLGLTLGLGVVDVRAEVTSYVASSPAWASADVVTSPLTRVNAVVVGASLTC